jgi:eukaryotic-like serine/threonine-protein kinase
VAAKLFDPGVGRQRVERYELLGEIASGGMATVYLARLTGMGGFQRFVAMKRLHPHLASEREFVEMFLDEARIAARIHHPNVVPILEVGASQVGYFLVMEYIEGDTLARLLARASSTSKRLPVSIALRIAIDMLSGLHAAHELRDDQNEPVNLVHRDVSPQNVLVGQDGIARITDFGVARAASRLNATRAGQLKGKIAYMAPEQAAGAEQLDRRADVFSAGVVIWESLAQKRLFKAENEAATLSRVIAEPVPLLTQVAPQVSSEVSQVVMRALDRDPDKRFPNCAAFADALEAAAALNDKVATPRELASYVNEVMGQEIAQQRESIRTWLAHSEPPGAELASGAMSSVSAAAMSMPGFVEPSRSSLSNTPPPLPPPPAPSRTPLVLGALLLFGLLSVGGFMLTRSARLGEPAAATQAPAAQTSPLVPAPSAAPGPVAAATETPAAPVSAEPAPTAQKPPAGLAGRGGSVTPAPRSRKKKPTNDVDLRNPYR